MWPWYNWYVYVEAGERDQEAVNAITKMFAAAQALALSKPHYVRGAQLSQLMNTTTWETKKKE